MKVALTGATGFLGRYIHETLLEKGHTCRSWYREGSDRTGMREGEGTEWIVGNLSNHVSMQKLVSGCDAVVHSAFDRPGAGFRGAEGDVPQFVQTNVVGTLQLIEAAREQGAKRFIFISTCAVHEKILDDRPLDEAHPLWASTHYGAHKAAIEKFVHAYGMGQGYEICALRPTGIYGEAHPVENSKWYTLVESVVNGQNVSSAKGGKEVHASDVAWAVNILLTADGIAGEAFNCYDQYIAHQDVASIAKELSESRSHVEILNKGPKHQIDTSKLRSLGMEFGGEPLLRKTVSKLVEAVRSSR